MDPDLLRETQGVLKADKNELLVLNWLSNTTLRSLCDRHSLALLTSSSYSQIFAALEMSAKDNPVELPRKLLLSQKNPKLYELAANPETMKAHISDLSPAEDGEIFLLEHTDGTTESAWNLIAAEAGHQDIDSYYCQLDHLDIHGNYYWGTSGVVESESVIISDYELEIVFNVWTDHYETGVDCESKWFVSIPKRSLYQFGEWVCEHDIELHYSSDILDLVREGTTGDQIRLGKRSYNFLPDSHPLFNQYVVGGRGFNRPKKDKQQEDEGSQD